MPMQAICGAAIVVLLVTKVAIAVAVHSARPTRRLAST